MRHCPNADCTYLRAHDEAAEYRDGFEQCSDCGALLVDGEAPSVAPAAPRHVPRSLWWRAAVSLGVPPALTFALGSVSLPTLDRDAIRSLALPGSLPALSLAAIGIQPILAAFLVVEIGALVSRRGRSLRRSGPAGRARLDRIVASVAVVVAAIQAFSIALYVESVRTPDGILLVPEPSWTNRAVLVLSLLAATSTFMLAARFVSRRGMTNGYAAFFGWSIVVVLGDGMVRTRALLAEGAISNAGVAIAALVLVGFVIGARYLMRAPGSRDLGGALHAVVPYRTAARRNVDFAVTLRVPTSGLVPVAALIFVASLPITLRQLGVPIPDPIDERTLPTLFGESVFLAVATVIFARAFHSPERIAALVAPAAGSNDGADAFQSAVRHALRRSIARSIVLVIPVALAQPLMERWTATPVFPSGLLLVSLVAIVLDGADEWRARAGLGEVVSVWCDSRTYSAEIALEVLASESIPAFVRGLHYRALEQFFAPFVPLEVFVRPQDSERATARLAQLFRDKGVSQSDAPPASEGS